MIRTRGGSRLRPRVRFSTPEREAPAPVPAPVPSLVLEAVPKEPQGFRRYQTRMGPRAPSPVPQRRVRRARPSKRARTSGPGESSSSPPQPSPVTSATEATSSPQLSPASRIRRPLFVGNPIPGNVRLYRRPFHQASYYDVPALRAEPEIQRSPAPQMSPPSRPPHTTSAAAADTPGPSYSAHHSPEYIHVSSREIAGVMDAICSLAATQAAQDQRLAQCHSMLQQIMTHLGLPRDPDQREEPTTDAASLDVLAAAAAASDPPPP